MKNRTIEIGNRQASDMTEQEISDLLYYFGFSASKQFWLPPVVTVIDRPRVDGEVWFEWTTTRKSDGLTHEHKGWIKIGNGGGSARNTYSARLVIVKHKYDNDVTGYDLPIQALSWLISKGFDIPIYTGQDSYFPIFTEH